MLALVLGLELCLGVAPQEPSPAIAATIDYELALVPAAGEGGFPLRRRPTWRVRVRGAGLDLEQGPVTLVFPHWREWRELDGLFVDTVAASPAVDAALLPGNAMVLQRPDDWDGSFLVEFAFAPLQLGTRVQEQHAQLPYWTEAYSFGSSRTVLPQVMQDSGRVPGVRRLHLESPGAGVASGWAGYSAGSQTLDLDPCAGNSLLAFGDSLRRFRASEEGLTLEALQYGDAAAVTSLLGAQLMPLARHMAESLGVSAPIPTVVFVTDAGAGGMAVEHGLVLGYQRTTPKGYVKSPYYRHFVAHELFHLWLGTQGSESVAWFHEGFTEYLSLWHLAASGGVDREWFASRIWELGREALERSTWGTLAFGDPAVSWRDGDGPQEVQAYKGGAMLAMAMDLELRDQGLPGVLALVRDLHAPGAQRVSLDWLRSWCEARGLEGFWARYVAGLERPDLESLLRRAGFERSGPAAGAAQGPWRCSGDGARAEAFLRVDWER